MKQQKTSGVSKLVASLLGAALLGLATQNAMALTAAGTAISNTANLAYMVGTVAQTPIASTAATFSVDYKVDVVVGGGLVYGTGGVLNTTVVPGQQPAATLAATNTNTQSPYLVFTVTNFSNENTGFKLSALDAATGVATGVAGATADAFNTTSNTMYVDSNNNGILDTGDTLASALVTPNVIASMTPGQVQKVFVVSAIPLTALDTQSAYVSLTAQAVWATAPAGVWPVGSTFGAPGAVIAATVGANTANVDVVLADAAGVADVVAATPLRDGSHSAYNAFKIGSASISVAKTVAVLCDVMNGGVNAISIPGSAQQYAITIKNAGSSAANLTSVSDTLVAQLVINPSFLGGTTGAAINAAACAGGAAAAVPGTTATGASFGFVTGTVAAPGYTAPTAAGGAVGGGAVVAAAGASVDAAGVVTINYASILTTAVAGPAAAVRAANGDLMPGEAVTVYFNTFVQ